MIIFVGLGNPGANYEKTYHNVGFLAIDKLADFLQVKISKKGYKSIYGQCKFEGEKIMLVKPQTYMNNSGQAALMLKSKFKDAKIVVVCDDIDLEKGKIRHRLQGSGGTHNGLRSIVSHIGQGFERIKIGIGRDEKDLADFVLSKMDNEFLSSSLDNFLNLIIKIFKFD